MKELESPREAILLACLPVVMPLLLLLPLILLPLLLLLLLFFLMMMVANTFKLAMDSLVGIERRQGRQRKRRRCRLEVDEMKDNEAKSSAPNNAAFDSAECSILESLKSSTYNKCSNKLPI